MKILFITFLVFVTCSVSYSQQKNKKEEFLIGIKFDHEFVLGGDVQVREWELQGDEMKLKDLGMRSYPALQLQLEKYFRKNNRLAITFNKYFMNGLSTFDRDIAFNGTLVDGRSGIDVSPTRYYRLGASYYGNLKEGINHSLYYIIGLVYDHATFYLDGVVSKNSPRNEVYEGFGKQALPYPVLGFGGVKEFGTSNKLNVELSGTYIPKFKSFFKEGGAIFLQYSTYQGELNYQRKIGDVDLTLGARIRYMNLFQESEEDTNILKTITAGPSIGLLYHF